MLFNSQVFLLAFLPIALLGLSFWVRHSESRLIWLIVLSLFFYGYWDLRFVPLLVGSVVVNWCIAKVFCTSASKLLITIGVAANLLVLALFKYLDFLSLTLTSIFSQEEIKWGIVLPLGISFFTFQQISYLVDLKRGEAPLYPLRRYFLYVTFFPQLIAGPIVRHHEFLSQLDIKRSVDERIEQTARGAALLLLGLCKKLFVADPLGNVSDQLFTASTETMLSFGEAWLAALAFTLQIYFDFSGYSDMAIGLGMLFGIVLPINFNAPYRAVSISDFWRRWHMTLSRFLRDYLYIPLGGNRHGPSRQMAALLVTMLLGGMWHGAAWTFVVWGGLHGAGLAINHFWRRARLPMPVWLGWSLTFVFVVVCFVLFRAQTFSQATEMLLSMSGYYGFEFAVQSLSASGWRPAIISAQVEAIVWVAAGLMLALVGPTSQSIAMQWLQPRLIWTGVFAIVYVVVVVAAGGPGAVEFVYFQF